MEKQKAHESKFRLSFHIIFIIKSQMSLWKRIGVNAKGKPIIEHQKYSVEIIRKQNEFYVNITFDETQIGRVLDLKETPQSDVIAGIDVNPDRIAVSLCTKQGNFKGSKNFYLQIRMRFYK